jgi:hypothetical protein
MNAQEKLARICSDRFHTIAGPHTKWPAQCVSAWSNTHIAVSATGMYQKLDVLFMYCCLETLRPRCEADAVAPICWHLSNIQPIPVWMESRMRFRLWWYNKLPSTNEISVPTVVMINPTASERYGVRATFTSLNKWCWDSADDNACVKCISVVYMMTLNDKWCCWPSTCVVHCSVQKCPQNRTTYSLNSCQRIVVSRNQRSWDDKGKANDIGNLRILLIYLLYSSCRPVWSVVSGQRGGWWRRGINCMQF